MPSTAIPTTTEAVWVFEHGGLDKLRYGRFPLPELGEQDVLVEVDTASVSRWDVKYRRGLAPDAVLPGRDPFPLPQQLGREAAGTVVAVGAKVTRFGPGDRVVGVVHPENPESPEAIRGLGNLSRGVELPGHQAPGGYARFVVRDAARWLPVPAGVDLEQAAVTLWPFGTAHRLVRDRLGVRLGETVLVLGAAGGMGQATVRLVRLSGARVIATTRRPGKADLLRELGADEVVVTTEHAAAVAEIRELTHGEGVDHAVDYTGSRDLLRVAVDALRLGGTVCPAAVEQVPPGPLPVSARDLTQLEMNVVGVRGARHRDALAALALLRDGRIHTRIAARYPFGEVARAHADLEHGVDLVGRIVLKPGAASSCNAG